MVRNIRNYESALGAFSEDESSVDAEDRLLKLLKSIDDAGLILEKGQRDKLLEFLYDLFQETFHRNRDNFKEWTILYQVFLDLIFFRRKERVMMYISENTKMFEKEERFGIEATKGAAQSRLNIIRDNMELCRQKCAECYYPCVLRKYHKGPGRAEFDEDHSCMLSDHKCRLQCDFCRALKPHDNNLGRLCDQRSHTCGNLCSVREANGCQQKCSLQIGHIGVCQCAAEKHYCTKTCAVEICESHCRTEYTHEHDNHLCSEQKCPYKCEVICWDEDTEKVIPCGKPCQSEDHAHALRMESGDCKEYEEDMLPKVESSGSGFCRVSIPHFVVGMIIGNNEFHLKAIEKRTGCTIEVQKYEDMQPGTGTRWVSLKGSEQSINAARQQIAKVLSVCSLRYNMTSIEMNMSFDAHFKSC